MVGKSDFYYSFNFSTIALVTVGVSVIDIIIMGESTVTLQYNSYPTVPLLSATYLPIKGTLYIDPRCKFISKCLLIAPGINYLVTVIFYNFKRKI